MLNSLDHTFLSHRSFFGNNSGANSSCPTKRVEWCTDDHDGFQLCIQSPTLLPTCILALIIGLTTSKSLAKLPGKFPSRWFYQLTFFLFGIMMTSAGILHCFLGDSQVSSNVQDFSMSLFYLFIAVLDVGLTSSIAVSFAFCGLCDVAIFNPKSFWTRFFLFTCYFLIFTLWTLGLLNQWQWINNVLYLGVITVGCSIYLLTQLCIKSNRHALPALFIGGIYAVIGLFATSFGAEHVCRSLGPFWSQYIGPEFIWFLFSDISVAFVYMYVSRANEQRKKRQPIGEFPLDLEKKVEKF